VQLPHGRRLSAPMARWLCWLKQFGAAPSSFLAGETGSERWPCCCECCTSPPSLAHGPFGQAARLDPGSAKRQPRLVAAGLITMLLAADRAVAPSCWPWRIRAGIRRTTDRAQTTASPPPGPGFWRQESVQGTPVVEQEQPVVIHKLKGFRAKSGCLPLRLNPWGKQHRPHGGKSWPSALPATKRQPGMECIRQRRLQSAALANSESSRGFSFRPGPVEMEFQLPACSSSTAVAINAVLQGLRSRRRIWVGHGS